jgi:hypothetical protein
MPCNEFIKQDRADMPIKYFLTNAESFVMLQPMKIAITGRAAFQGRLRFFKKFL